MCAQTGLVLEGEDRDGVPGCGEVDTRGVGSGVSGFEVFVVVGEQEGGV